MLTQNGYFARLQAVIDENEKHMNSYELAYHLSPDIEETKVAESVASLIELLNASGAQVGTRQEPRRLRLAYPIAHKRYAYFGSFEVSAMPESLSEIEKSLHLRNEVLRFLVIKKMANRRDLRASGLLRGTVSPRPVAPEPVPTLTPEEETKKDKQLEEALDTILEKI